MGLAIPKRVLGIALAAILIAVIFVPLNKVNALSIDIDPFPSTPIPKDNPFDFNVLLHTNTGEHVPVNELHFIFDENTPSQVTITTDKDGNILSTSHPISGVTRTSGVLSFSSSSYAEGLITPDGNTGYGYGYGYGYGFGANQDVNLKVTVDPAFLDSGSHTLRVEAVTGLFPNSVYTSTYSEFSIASVNADTGIISGIKYLDENNNGVQDTGESGLSGWTINLLNKGTNATISMTTGANGTFSFNGLAAGSYILYETQKPEYSNSQPAAHVNWNDTTFYPAYDVTLAAGEHLTFDFGNVREAIVSGVKYNDLNGNGVRDAGEPGIEGVTIFLTDDEGEHETQTAADGSYSFFVAPGSFSIGEAVPDGYFITQPAAQLYTIVDGPHQKSFFYFSTIAPEATKSGFDIGNALSANFPATISGLKFNDLNGNGVRDAGEPGMAGVSIEITDNSGVHHVTTAADGSYSASVAPGAVRVAEAEQMPGFAIVSPNSSFSAFLNAYQEVPPNNSTGGGSVDFFLDEATSTLNYVMYNHDLMGNPTGAHINLGAYGRNGQVQFDLEIVKDTVTIGSIGPLSPTQLAALSSNQMYVNIETDGIPSGEIRGQIINSGPHRYLLTVGPNETRTGLDFANAPYPTISGVKYNDLNANGVRDAGEPGMAGVVIHAFDMEGPHSATTDADGSYSIQVAPGLVELVEVPPSDTIPNSPHSSFLVHMSNSSVVPPSSAIGFGEGDLFFDSASSMLVYRGIGIVGSADYVTSIEIHSGSVGVNGPVLFTLENKLPSLPFAPFEGKTTALNSTQIAALYSGDLYIQINTDQYPNGAIRGQIQFDASSYHYLLIAKAGQNQTNIDFGNRIGIPVSGHGAIIGSGNVILGVDNAGQLNIPYREVPELGLPASDPGHPAVGSVGLRNAGGQYASTEPGCLCEGWGVAIPHDSASSFAGTSGYANNAEGSGNLDVVQFVGEDGDTTATSIVDVLDPFGTPVLRVTHNYTPSTLTPNLYNVTVTVQNLTNEPLSNVTYRRVMDWDIQPTQFYEYVTIQGTSTTSRLIHSGNNGFASSDPLSATDYEIYPYGTKDKDFEYSGPADHGSIFDFDIGPIPADGSTTLHIFYGDAPNQHDAANAISAVGAELFSIGQPTLSTGADPQPDTQGQTGPTFIFAFGGVGGEKFELGNNIRITIVKYNDLNGNGVRDSNEPVLPGFMFEVRDANGALVGMYTSNSFGRAIVSIDAQVHPGPYTVTELPTTGSISTTPTTVLVSGLKKFNTVTFGNQLTGTIEGTKYTDVNGNGIRDSGEAGMAGVTIKATRSSDSHVDTTVTDSLGKYKFANLSSGTYAIEEVTPSGFAVSQPFEGTYSVTVSSGTHLFNLDFGNFPVGDTLISGKKYIDANVNGIFDSGDSPQSGVTMQLFRINPTTGAQTLVTTATTDSSGNYVFNNIVPGQYKVDELPNPITAPFTPLLGYYRIFVSAGQHATGFDFGNAPKNSSISGFKYIDNNHNGAFDAGDTLQAGVTIHLSRFEGVTGRINEIATQVTAADGTYLFDHLPPGTYQLTETVPLSLDGYVPTQPIGGVYYVFLHVNEARANMNFGNSAPVPGAITGHKFLDSNGNGVQDAGESGQSGITIQLTGPTSATTTTAADGSFSFNNLPIGSYTVSEVVPAGYEQTTPVGPSTFPVNVGPGQTATTDIFHRAITFGNHQLSLGSISGLKYNDLNGNGVRDAGEPPISGVTINLYNYYQGVTTSVQTDSAGQYNFANLRNGYYYVWETLPSGLAPINPLYGAYFTYLYDGESQTKDFGNAIAVSSISGLKWNDTNKDGVHDAGEPAWPGVNIDLYRRDPVFGFEVFVGTNVTDSNGRYEFDGLAPGAYTVKELAPFGSVQTYPANELPNYVTLPANVNIANVDFGNAVVPPGFIEVVKFNDENRNQQKDAGEGLLGGTPITVSNYYTYRTETSNTSTPVTFTLPPGNYYVYENPPAGTVSTTQSYQAITVTSGQTTTVMFGNRILTPIPTDITIDGHSGGGAINHIRGHNLAVEKDLTQLFSSTLKTASDVVSVKATVTLDDGTERTATLTRQDLTNVWSGTVNGPFYGSNSLKLVIDVDFSPSGPDFGDAREIGDIILVDPQGNIYDRTTGSPLAGATVLLQQDSGGGLFVNAPTNTGLSPAQNPLTTDAAGFYQWTFVPAGNYKVTASKPGYNPAESSVMAIPPPRTGVNLFLMPVGASLTYSVNTSSPSITLSQSVTATSTTNDAIANKTKFEWINPSNTVVSTETITKSGSTAQSTFTPTATGTWTVKATFTDGTTTYGTDTKTITVGSASYSVVPSPSTINFGQSTTATSTTNDARATKTTFEWLNPSNTVAFSQTISKVGTTAASTFIPTIDGSWTVRATFTDGTTNYSVQTATVTVNPVAIPTYAVGTSLPSINLGQSVTATSVTNDALATKTKFEWMNPSNTVAFTETVNKSGTTAQSTFSPTVIGSWTVKATFTDGTTTYSTKTATVTVNAAPTYQVSASSSSITFGQSATATSTTDDSLATKTKFEWMNPSNTVAFTQTVDKSGSTAASTFTPTVIGTWTVKATFTDGTNNYGTATTTVTVNSSGGGGGGGGGGSVVLTPTPTTYPDSYFASNPLAKVKVESSSFKDSTGATISTGKVGQQVSISTSFQNSQQKTQSYAIIIQVLDKDGFTVDLGWISGKLDPGQKADASKSWMVDASGNYTIKIYVWDSVSGAPLPLSDVTAKAFVATQ